MMRAPEAARTPKRGRRREGGTWTANAPKRPARPSTRAGRGPTDVGSLFGPLALLAIGAGVKLLKAKWLRLGTR